MVMYDWDRAINEFWIPDLLKQNFVNPPEARKVTTGFDEEDLGLAADLLKDQLSLFTVQWVPSMQTRLDAMSIEEFNSAHDAIPPGAFARNRSSPFYTPAVPDLIGVRDR